MIRNHFHTGTKTVLAAVLLASLMAGCAGSRAYTLRPVKTFDPDTARIPEPEEADSYNYWDRIDNTLFHQLEKPLDLNRTFRFTGRLLGVADARQADNVNSLDNVPESSWYTYRHFHNPMTLEELARGPNTVPPDTSRPWTIFSAKLEGANPGFFIEDARGNRYLIKFDGPSYPELTTAAEVIGTKIFYAAGYYVPEATITYFDPDQVTIGEGVTVVDKGEERAMTISDYREIVENKPQNDTGKIRALASKFVDGIPVGPWGFEGTRKDDPNDRIPHEHRREIRGMRVISSWLNDTDRRDANTMSVYTDQGYIKHLVQDFGNTLGANGGGIHTPIYGQAYLVDPRHMSLSLIGLGGYIRPWNQMEMQVPYPSVGYFRADVLKPGRWVSAHPLPAYENMTLRDAYWGARMVMSFSNDEIRAIVETGKITNSNAIDYLVRVLAERRDKIGRHWFTRINPLDKFDARFTQDSLELTFKDLGTAGDLFDPAQTRYEYRVDVVDGENIAGSRTIDRPSIYVDRRALDTANHKGGQPAVLRFEIVTHRGVEATKKPVVVFVAMKQSGPRIVGIQR